MEKIAIGPGLLEFSARFGPILGNWDRVGRALRLQQAAGLRLGELERILAGAHPALGNIEKQIGAKTDLVQQLRSFGGRQLSPFATSRLGEVEAEIAKLKGHQSSILSRVANARESAMRTHMDLAALTGNPSALGPMAKFHAGPGGPAAPAGGGFSDFVKKYKWPIGLGGGGLVGLYLLRKQQASEVQPDMSQMAPMAPYPAA